MFVSAQVIDNATALLAVNHVSVKTATMAGFEITNPCDRLSAERVKVCVVPNSEGNIGTIFGKHNPSPATYIEKRQREELAAPNLLHHALADGRAPVFAPESEALLNFGMQELKLIAQRLFVNRFHAGFSGLRRQRAAVGRSRPAMMAISASAAMDIFKVSGLKAAVRYSGALIATTGMPTTIKARLSHNG